MGVDCLMGLLYDWGVEGNPNDSNHDTTYRPSRNHLGHITIIARQR